MNKEVLMERAKEIQPELQNIRRALHRHPEAGFEQGTFTKPFIMEELKKMGYEVQEVGKTGLVTTIGKMGGKCFLLRADMDALPLTEEADVPYKSQTPGRMHACGHDMHATMLLGAAKLLKEFEDDLEGCVKLEWQPAEEIFQGSTDMIEAGLLENPHVDAAMMMHMNAAVEEESGHIRIFRKGGVVMTSCDQYHIIVKGHGSHGSMPHLSKDPITAAAHIHIALQEINSRELNGHDFGVFTTCHFEAGKTSNIIPETAEMWGTIRTVDEEGLVAEQIKQRMTEIAKGVGAAFRCDVEVEFYDHCPSMVVNPDLAEASFGYMTELLGEDKVTDTGILLGGRPESASEDFAFVTRKVPAVGFNLTGGAIKDGYTYNLHNPKVRFDDSILYVGSAAYVYNAARWLEDNK